MNYIFNYQDFINENFSPRKNAIDLFIEGSISENEMNDILNSVNEGLGDVIEKVIGYLKSLATKIKTIGGKIFSVAKGILNFATKFIKDHKLITIIGIIILMMVISSTMAYAAANPHDTTTINAALGFIDNYSNSWLDAEYGHSVVAMAKAMLSEMKKGHDVNMTEILNSDNGAKAKAMVESTIKFMDQMKLEDPSKYGKLAHLGEGVVAIFRQTVNGIVTINIGG